MSPFEWTIIVITGLGFLLTTGGVVVAVTRTIGKLTTEFTERMAADRENAATQLARSRDELFSHFNKGQAQQDQYFGELGLSLRRYIESVEKEMHKIEIWGRDNYVQKGELEGLRSDLKALAAEIKVDLKELGQKIDDNKNRNAAF